MTDLLISSSAVVHVEGCPHMRHVQDGVATYEREKWTDPIWESSELAEIAMVRTETVSVDRRITEAEIEKRTTKYSRCSTCAPNVSEWVGQRRTVRKKASGLSFDDVGREAWVGRIKRIVISEHTVQVHGSGGTLILAPSEHIDFYVKGSPHD